MDVSTEQGEYQVLGDCKVLQGQHRDLTENPRVIVRHSLRPVQNRGGSTILSIDSFFPI
ncbi:TPA: hypothetical protein HA241_04200 [Candidatus Woesearchaeota archaeon]|nr:hypothetical protein [Candidatus Woesearchaeota archaeon]